MPVKITDKWINDLLYEDLPKGFDASKLRYSDGADCVGVAYDPSCADKPFVAYMTNERGLVIYTEEYPDMNSAVEEAKGILEDLRHTMQKATQPATVAADTRKPTMAVRASLRAAKVSGSGSGGGLFPSRVAAAPLHRHAYLGLRRNNATMLVKYASAVKATTDTPSARVVRVDPLPPTSGRRYITPRIVRPNAASEKAHVIKTER